MSKRGPVLRIAVSVGVLALAMAGVGFRLVWLHVATDEATREAIEQKRQYTEEIPASRGNLLDCRPEANILALDVTRWDVCANPKTVISNRCVEAVAARAEAFLGIPCAQTAARFTCPTQTYLRIQRFVDEGVVAELKRAGVPGLFFPEAPLRFYPQDTFMCHVRGFVNYEGVGSAGVEQVYDADLRGIPGYVESEKNAQRREIRCKRALCVPPVRGADVTLTLDRNLQYIVERALDDVLREHHAAGAWAIVEEVRTGAILAMASRPAYNPNEFRRADTNELLNRAIGYVYEPGSTLKAATIAAALDQGIVTPETVFDCERGAWTYKSRLLRDYRPHGLLTVAEGIQKSSNILTAKVAVMLGDSRLHAALRAFGFGWKTGVDLPGEETGILHPVSQWSGISVTRIAIGQGVAVTALQILNSFCAIANEGRLMRPYVVREIRAADGSLLRRCKPEVIGQAIRPETAAVMRGLLARVTEEGGTGQRAGVAGYAVAGKTGTAQKPVPGGYSSTAYMASFVGFLPAEHPEIGVVVVVDEPQPFHTGGVVAGPVFGRIAAQAVRYLDIPPVSRDAVARR